MHFELIGIFGVVLPLIITIAVGIAGGDYGGDGQGGQHGPVGFFIALAIPLMFASAVLAILIAIF